MLSVVNCPWSDGYSSSDHLFAALCDTQIFGWTDRSYRWPGTCISHLSHLLKRQACFVECFRSSTFICRAWASSRRVVGWIAEEWFSCVSLLFPLICVCWRNIQGKDIFWWLPTPVKVQGSIRQTFETHSPINRLLPRPSRVIVLLYLRSSWDNT